jgi:hypothetical protein
MKTYDETSDEKTQKRPMYLLSADSPLIRSAGFQTCCAADFQVGSSEFRPAGLETCGTADLEVCGTLNVSTYLHIKIY